MDEIIIGKPYIVGEGNVTRLESVIKGQDFEKVHYFEVENNFSKYLCAEKSDAFVASLLYFAMVNGYNIRNEIPMSEKLYYQLKSILIPTMNNYYPDRFHNIEIFTELDARPIENVGAVGCAVSGGVDSFYTIVSNSNLKTTNFKVTHLLVANSFNMFYGDEDTRKRYKGIADNAQIIANDMKLPLVKIYSNNSEFWFSHYQNVFCAKYASYPLALQKLFSKYYFSAGYEYKDFLFSFNDWDSAYYDVVSVPNFSNENFDFILSGGGVSRVQKIKAIADNKTVHKYLQVCNLNKENCSVCSKCMRTQMSIYAEGKLDKFNQSFKLKLFEREKNKYITQMLYKQGPYDKDNLKSLSENKIKIGYSVLIIGKILRPIYLVKEFFMRNKGVLKVYTFLRRNDDRKNLEDIERYNIDKEFAKKCDKGII